jgi:hypothetical protein
MTKRLLINLVFAAISILFLKCDGGLFPSEKGEGITGFSGKITFTGDWPQGIKRTHLVVFKNPIVQAEDFFPPNLNIIMDSIAYGSSEFNYNSIDNNYVKDAILDEGDYAYIVVAQSRSAELSLLRQDWTVAGIYYASTGTTEPGILRLEKGKMTRNINIICDFNNPPPQPPGGQAARKK